MEAGTLHLLTASFAIQQRMSGVLLGFFFVNQNAGTDLDRVSHIVLRILESDQMLLCMHTPHTPHAYHVERRIFFFKSRGMDIDLINCFIAHGNLGFHYAAATGFKLKVLLVE